MLVSVGAVVSKSVKKGIISLTHRQFYFLGAGIIAVLGCSLYETGDEASNSGLSFD